METKKCGKCGQVLPTSEFHKHSKSKDGLQYMCKNCHRDYQRQHATKSRVVDVGKSSRVQPMSMTDGQYKRNPALANFHPRELIEELHARNYRGKLTFTREIVV